MGLSGVGCSPPPRDDGSAAVTVAGPSPLEAVRIVTKDRRSDLPVGRAGANGTGRRSRSCVRPRVGSIVSSAEANEEIHLGIRKARCGRCLRRRSVWCRQERRSSCESGKSARRESSATLRVRGSVVTITVPAATSRQRDVLWHELGYRRSVFASRRTRCAPERADVSIRLCASVEGPKRLRGIDRRDRQHESHVSAGRRHARRAGRRPPFRGNVSEGSTVTIAGV